MIRRRVGIKRSVRAHFSRRHRKEKPTEAVQAWLDWLHAWPCFICFKEHCEKYNIPFWRACHEPAMRELFRERSFEICGETQAAHVGSKGTGQLCPERERMPLGMRHHMHPTMGGFQDSHHAGTKTFWTKHGLERMRALEFLRRLYVDETGREI